MPNSRKLTPDQLKWVKAAYRVNGWNFAEVVDLAIRDAASEKTAQDQRKTNDVLAKSAAQRIRLASTTEEEDVKEDIADLYALLENDDTDIDDDDVFVDADTLNTLRQNAKDSYARLEKVHKKLPDFAEYDHEREAFQAAFEIAQKAVQKSALQLKLGLIDGAQTSLQQVEDNATAMTKVWQDVQRQLHEKQEKAQRFAALPDEVKQIIGKVEFAATLMKNAGFPGLAIRFTEASQKTQADKFAHMESTWAALLDECETASAGSDALKHTRSLVELTCYSLHQLGVHKPAAAIETSLKDYTTTDKRSFTTVSNMLIALKKTAMQKEAFYKTMQWDAAGLGDRTDKIRKQLEDIVRVGPDGKPLTRKDDKHFVAQDGDTLVMDEVVRRKDKHVPRPAVEALVASTEYLEQLKETGKEGLEGLIAEELMKVEDILDGIKSNPKGYKKLEKKISTINSRLADLSKDKDKAAFYIDERVRLEADLEEFADERFNMNVEKALATCNDMIASRLAPLEENIERAAEYRKLFDAKADKTDQIFKKIPKALAAVGKADASLAGTFSALFAPESLAKYHGELEDDLSKVKQDAYNAKTADDLADALEDVNNVLIHAERMIYQLVGLLKVKQDKEKKGDAQTTTTPTGKVAAQVAKNPLGISDQEEKYFKKLQADYEAGVKKAKRKELAKKTFDGRAEPLKEELDALLAGKFSIDNLIGKFRGYERVDEKEIDVSRLREIQAQLKELEETTEQFKNHEESMAQLKEIESSMTSVRSQIQAFREDKAKDVVTFAKNCVARLERAKEFIDKKFVAGVQALEDPSDHSVHASVLNKFVHSVSTPLKIGKLMDHVAVIANPEESVENKKKAREMALRIVSPLLATLDSSKAIRMYRNHPFTELPNDLNAVKPELALLEVKLLSLAK